jgi:hypothetical protein
MVRLRLILFVTIAALVAPALAPCLMAAPDGHASMPCCRALHRGTVARPCCGSDGEGTSTPPSAGASRLYAPGPLAAAVVPAEPIAATRIDAHPRPISSLTARLRSTVLLI